MHIISVETNIKLPIAPYLQKKSFLAYIKNPLKMPILLTCDTVASVVTCRVVRATAIVASFRKWEAQVVATGAHALVHGRICEITSERIGLIGYGHYEII